MSVFLKIEQAIETKFLDDLKTDMESKLVNLNSHKLKTWDEIIAAMNEFIEK